jgi:hypothetical protein
MTGLKKELHKMMVESNIIINRRQQQQIEEVGDK